MSRTLIRRARLIDPVAGTDAVRDVLVASGRVARVASELSPEEAREGLPDAAELSVVDAEGLWLLPGLVDAHVHLREPGFPEKETLATGTRAAAAGGCTTVVCEPNTDPPLDTPARVRELADRAERDGIVRVYVKGAMTEGRGGERPADVAALAAVPQVVALSDDGDPVVDPAVMATVCRLAAAARVPLAAHCEDSPRALEAFDRGEKPGFSPGEPYTNEARYVRRDLALAAQFGCRIHFSHASVAESVEAIRAAPDGARATFEATPHHLLLCREDYPLGEVPTVNPPIRSEEDRRALREAVTSGQCDAIASDHAPHTAEDKAAGACGLVGLETTLGLVLTHFVAPGLLTPADAVRLLSAGPARVFGLPGGTLRQGSVADMVLVDPARKWTVQPEAFRSRSRNTPYAGWKLRGKALATYVAGDLVYRDKDFGARSGDEDLRGRQ